MSHGAASAAPISWQEIGAWQERMGVSLTPWESHRLRALSVEYMAENHKAEDPACPQPWQPVDYVPDHKGVANALKNSISKLLKL